MKDIFSVIVKPILTEKTTLLGEENRQFCFQVKPEANKIEIGQAVEKLFGVKVSKVRTTIQRGKAKRFGRYYGQRSNWKKAYVTLAEGYDLDLLAGA